MNLDACRLLERGPETGTWYRATEPVFFPKALSTRHTVRYRSRFSPGRDVPRPFEVLYLAENQLVALYEAGLLFGPPSEPGMVVPRPNRPCTIVNVRVHLQQVADLTRVSQQTLLRTTVQELTGDWEGYHVRTPQSPVPEPIGQAPTQELGEALFGVPELEAFRTVSAHLCYHRNLVVFPQKLLPGSRVEFHDPGTGLRRVLKPRQQRRGR